LPAAFSLQRTGFLLVVADLGTAVVVAGPGTVVAVVAGLGTVVAVAVGQHQFAVGELAHHSTC